jgi:hypothetical protein
MYYAAINVQPLKDYLPQLTFKTGEQKVFDMKPFLNIGILKALKDELIYNTASISFETVESANKADIDPETLYKESYRINKPNTNSL